REDVEVARQFLYRARSAEEISGGSRALFPAVEPVPQPDQLLGREPADGLGGADAFLQRAEGYRHEWRARREYRIRATFPRGNGRRFQYPGSAWRTVRTRARIESPAQRRSCCSPGLRRIAAQAR